MWGHYADGHKGYCLEFNKEKLEKWAKPIPGKLAGVVYSDSYPNLRDYLECDKEGPRSDLDKLLLLRKSSHWEYEKEWRIIVDIDWQKTSPQIHCVSEDVISGVIFGCDMLSEDEATIRRNLEGWNKKPRIYKTKKSEYEYAVEIQEWD